MGKLIADCRISRNRSQITFLLPKNDYGVDHFQVTKDAILLWINTIHQDQDLIKNIEILKNTKIYSTV